MKEAYLAAKERWAENGRPTALGAAFDGPSPT
jgi:hypothetical protein